MAYHGLGYRPPLPPRSPRPSFGASSSPGYSQFSPLSPGSSLGNESSNGTGEALPPVPPRPLGFHTSPGPCGQYDLSPSSSPLLAPPGHHGQGFLSFPPPPISPNRVQATGQAGPPPLPPRLPLQSSGSPPGSNSSYGTLPAPCLTPSALSPNQLTSFPPPPPGPPPQRTSLSLVPYHAVSPQVSLPGPSAIPSEPSQPPNGGFQSKFPLLPDPPIDPEIPSSPPPAYTLLAEPGSQIGIKTNPGESYYSETSSPVAAAGTPQAEPHVSSAYTTFPAASFAQTTTPSPISLPLFTPPDTYRQSTASVPSPAPVTSPVSNPQSPNEISFFPTPPLVSPVPQKDPIEDLMQSMSLTSTPASESSSNVTQNGAFSSPLSTPAEDPRSSPYFADASAAPTRPPKAPLAAVKAASPHGSHEASRGSASDHFRRAETSVPPFNKPARKPLSVASSCIDAPVTFVTTWYTHPGAPDFLVCSRCYADHISGCKFASMFRRSNPDDGKPRVCRFSRPRMKDHIFPAASSTSYLQPLIDYMRHRSGILDCRGADGVIGSAESVSSTKWYNTVNNSIPGFLCCEACYEDYVKCVPTLSNFLQAHPQVQGPKEVWACDFALPFIQKQYEADGKSDSPQDAWNNFALEAKSRIGIPRCGQAQNIRSHGKKWFQPISGPAGLIICASCYCDEVIHTGEESKWRVVPGLTEARDMQVRCARGGRFNIRIAMARAHEVKDFSLFWNAIKKLEAHPMCEDSGVEGAEWWTLLHQPEDFQVCGACYVAICEPLGVHQFFAKKQSPSGMSTPLRCCFNIAHPRLKNYMPRLLEMYFCHDPSALNEYASVYAAIPLCGRDEAREGAKWYGWDDCKVCAECFQDFAGQHPLARQMALRNDLVQQSTMCELYSPRMRQLYLLCSQKSPPDAIELLQFARHRRQVYSQTIPQVKHTIQQQKLALEQQRMLNSLSSFHTNSGQIQQIMYGSSFTYSAPGMGTFNTMEELQGAQYGRQAMGVMQNAHGAVGIVTQLEQQWRAVE
ncbi:integral membrane protein [Seiridium cupressi]